MRFAIVSLVALMLASAVMAAPADLFTAYEETRQALVRQSLPDVQAAAKKLATAAQGEKQKEIARRAEALTGAATLPAAREAFAAVSETAVQYRNSVKGPKPLVAYCSMEKKSWLQPTTKISNPYSPKMPACGEIVGEPKSDHNHH